MKRRPFHVWLQAPRVQRWALALSTYNYTMTYRQGCTNANADALSRLPLPDIPAVMPMSMEIIYLWSMLSQTPVSAKNIRVWTQKYPLLSKVYKFIMNGWPQLSQNNTEYMIIDAHSKWIDVLPTSSASAASTACLILILIQPVLCLIMVVLLSERIQGIHQEEWHRIHLHFTLPPIFKWSS